MCRDYFKNNELRFPDYNNSILNTISSILKYYGIDNGHNTLNVLDKKLLHEYKNVVLFVLDGMGEHILNNLSSKGF